jgi:cobyrinic acid a,c-diamide synthase
MHAGDKMPPRLMISAPSGRSGKTIVSIGICWAMRKHGLSVQSFKKGPDYIDPSWLTIATGRSSRNLDSFLIPKDKLLLSFEQAMQGADIALVEGAMGLYDGLDRQDNGTTADLAKLLNIPILLVVNAARMTSSIAAMVTGYQRFQFDIRIAGVILNQVSGKRHEKKLRDAVERYCSIPVVGSIPRDSDLHIGEHHLGLIPALESTEAESFVRRIGSVMESCLDLENILKIANHNKRDSLSPPVNGPKRDGQPSGEELASPNRFSDRRCEGAWKKKAPVKIGVLRDRAFHFYYPENLEALKRKGAELIFIDSFRDRLPRDIDGLYIGGGFPELFLDALEGNRVLRQEIAKAIEGYLPVYAECAGLMYLGKGIRADGKYGEMVGSIPIDVEMQRKPQGHGYVEVEVVRENPLFPVGLKLRGHEFHHSRLSHLNGLQGIYKICQGKGLDGKTDGLVYKNVFAAYTHLHALGVPQWAEGFISLVLRQQKFQTLQSTFVA